MPILLKKKNKTPGVIVFTHAEALYGVPAKFKNIKNLLINKSINNDYIFGIHIQGDISWIGYWKKENWQSFFMWQDKKAKVLSKIKKNKIIELNCINFYPTSIRKFYDKKKFYDICCIAKFSELKKINLTLNIFKQLIKVNKNYRFLLICPISSSKDNYEKNIINKIKTTFKTTELKNIDFICNQEKFFGRFPVSNELIYSLISKSKALMLNSHQEGVPRVIIEALLLDTKVILSKNLKSGIKKYLTKNNSLIYNIKNEDPKKISKQIKKFLKTKEYISNQNFKNNFYEKNNQQKLINLIGKASNINDKSFYKTNNGWQLNNLVKRLACHGYDIDYTFFNNDESLFKWFSSLKKYSFSKEEEMYINLKNIDKSKKFFSAYKFYFKFFYDKFENKIKNYIK